MKCVTLSQPVASAQMNLHWPVDSLTDLFLRPMKLDPISADVIRSAK